MMCKSVGYWSLCDFYEIESGVVQIYIENELIKIESHVFECQKCK